MPSVPSSPAGLARYVVVGASDAVGYGADDPDAHAWPEVLRTTVLPAGCELVNLGIAGATVAVALEFELPAALASGATVAMVWLAVNDLLAGVPADTYESQLGGLVNALRRGGTTRVLVGNTPPLERLPIYVAFQADPDRLDGSLPPPESISAAVAAYNDAIDRVAAEEGAELVDLHSAALAARAAGTDESLVGIDGFHPSSAGHRTLAASFAAVLGLP